MRGRLGLALLLALSQAPSPGAAQDAPAPLDRKVLEAFAQRFAKARPKTAFERWDPTVRQALLAEAKALGPLPEGALAATVDVLWKALVKDRQAVHRKGGGKTSISTPYGPATWLQHGQGGRKAGLVLGLHGGGEGAGSAGEAAGTWSLPGCLGMYPQGIRLVHDTWNTVHGERFALTLIETAKLLHDVDPSRVYAMGFSMGGTGSWFLAGRHPDLLAGAAPCAGVLMAAPKSQVATKEEVTELQHGLLPNVRNLAMVWFAGLKDRNCMPGTYLYAWDRLGELRAADPEGYRDLEFTTYPELAHAMAPGEPSRLFKWLEPRRRDAFPTKVVWEQAESPFPQPEDELDRTVGRVPKLDFYWLHCERPSDRALAVATRRGNEFDLTVTGGDWRDYTLWLSPAILDVTAEVVVRAQGKEVYRGRPVPDLLTVLETLDARADRVLVFDRRVNLGGL